MQGFVIYAQGIVVRKFVETQVLPKSIILSPLFCFSKKRLFEEVADCAGYILGKPPKEIVEALNTRERYGTTVFYPGIAIPHAVIDSDHDTFCILSILDKPITFNSIDADEQLIDIAFCLFISKNDDEKKVEALLKNLTVILSNNDLLNALRLAKNEISKLTILLNKIDYILDKPAIEENTPQAE